MTLHRVVALLKLKVTFCSLVRRELCALQRAALLSAPCFSATSLKLQILFVMGKHKDTHINGFDLCILHHLPGFHHTGSQTRV